MNWEQIQGQWKQLGPPPGSIVPTPSTSSGQALSPKIAKGWGNLFSAAKVGQSAVSTKAASTRFLIAGRQ